VEFDVALQADRPRQPDTCGYLQPAAAEPFQFADGPGKSIGIERSAVAHAAEVSE